MRKSILILVGSVVLFSLFNTTETNFRFWNNPTINTDYINFPDVPVSFETDISIFGLFINFFSDLELDYSINNTAISDGEITNSALEITNIITKQNSDYYIQFAASDDPENPKKSFPEIDNFDTYINDGLIHYTLGNFSSLDAAEDKMYSIRALGYSDAFVFTFKNDERVCFFIPDIDDHLENQDLPITKQEITPPPPQVTEIESYDVNPIAEEVEVIIVEEVIEEKVETPSVEEIKRQAELQAVREVKEGLLEDIKILMNNPRIKGNAKELLLESLESGIITMDDVVGLLSENSGKKIKGKHVKKLIKSKKK